MVYFRIEMGLGKDPKENKCNATIARRLNGMSFAKAEAERIDKEQRHKTAYNYLTAVRSLTQFIGNANGALPTSQPLCLSAISGGFATEA